MINRCCNTGVYQSFFAQNFFMRWRHSAALQKNNPGRSNTWVYQMKRNKRFISVHQQLWLLYLGYNLSFYFSFLRFQNILVWQHWFFDICNPFVIVKINKVEEWFKYWNKAIFAAYNINKFFKNELVKC